MDSSGNKQAHFGYTVFDLSVEEQLELAVLAEELGFDAVWYGEHIVMPVGSQSVYTPDLKQDATKGAGLPRSIYDAETRLYDLVAMCAATARETTRIAIITGVYLATLRHPLMTARTIATLDELSRGRFQLGVGAGWNQNEMGALGGNFEDRGRILDETVEILRLAMGGGPFEYHGKHFSFGPMQISQEAFKVPILFGGHSTPALRRAARMGDGWVSSITNSPEDLLKITRRIDQLREEVRTADRPFDHWIKVNTRDPEVIARLRALGADRFVLYGDQIWGPGKNIALETRKNRLKGAARALGIGPA